MRRQNMAVVADLLTISRLGIAVVLTPAAWSLDLGLTAVLVSIAWVTDVLDGRLARAAGVEGRMGRWDLAVDTSVGASLLVGLAGAGEIPVWFAAGSLVALGGWFLTGNVAASMLLQLAGYVPLIGILVSQRPAGWWIPILTAMLIGVVDWRRLLRVNIPNFVHGLTGFISNRSRRGW